MSTAPASDRFVTLDALRGVAALSVLAFHAHLPFASLPSGYLAVDLFFSLSGFVLARSYAARLRQGMTWGEFARRRVARLWPMGALGALLGIVLFHGNPNMLLLIPDVMSPLDLYPTNPVLWSLLFELIVNLAWAAVAVRLGPRSLAAVLAVSGAVLFAGILDLRSAIMIGPFWFSAAYGLVRTVFSFTVGLAMARIGSAEPRRSHLAWLPLVALPALLAFAPEPRAWWDMACIAIALPILLWLGIRWQLPARRLATGLGDLSYPLYCIHVPVLVFIAGREGTSLPASLALVPIALVLERWCDRPARAALARRLLRGARYTRIGIST